MITSAISRSRFVIMKTTHTPKLIATALFCVLTFTPEAPAQTGDYKLDRTTLPVPEPQTPVITELDARQGAAAL